MLQRTPDTISMDSMAPKHKFITGTDSRFGNIDALRGVAAILVIWMHSSEFFARLPGGAGASAWPYALARTIDFGRIGVVLFFGISGFVILSSLRERSKGWMRTFAIRRFFRLYPVYWISIPIGVITMAAFGDPIPSIGSILANFSMLQEYIGFESVQGIYWTLHVEIVFYMLCAVLFLFYISDDDKVLALCVIVCILVFVFTRMAIALLHIEPRFMLHAFGMLALHISIMFWGALVRLRFERKVHSYTASTVMYGYGAGFAVLLFTTIILGVLSKLPLDSDYFRLGVAYPLALLVFALGCYSKMLGNRATIYLGRISYSLYLFHNTVICMVYFFISRGGMQMSTAWSLLMAIVASIFLTIVCASLTFRFVEQPLIKLGAVLAKRNIRKLTADHQY